MTEPWEPTTKPDGEPTSIGEVVGQALGTASACWENVGGAGVFDSTRCEWVYNGLMTHIDKHIAAQRWEVANKWSEIAYEMWNLIANGEAIEGQNDWEQAKKRIRDRFHAALEELN